jgi:hypothetical protein
MMMSAASCSVRAVEDIEKACASFQVVHLAETGLMINIKEPWGVFPLLDIDLDDFVRLLVKLQLAQKLHNIVIDLALKH